MEINIKDLELISGVNFSDERGRLVKPFSRKFSSELHNIDFKETWFTRSRLGVIRGMHMQTEPLATRKLVSVLKGKIIDVVLDVRPDSETYGNEFVIEMDEIDSFTLLIPVGCAHGYEVLVDDTIVMYMADQVHSEELDIGYHFRSLNYQWITEKPIISEKDKTLPKWKTQL